MSLQKNHGSLVCERSIQSISNMLLSNLQGRGRAWAYYVQAVCHAYNTFAHTSLGGYSPFKLVYMRQPPDWLNIKCDPQSVVGHSQGEDEAPAKFGQDWLTGLGGEEAWCWWPGRR